MRLIVALILAVQASWAADALAEARKAANEFSRKVESGAPIAGIMIAISGEAFAKPFDDCLFGKNLKDAAERRRAVELYLREVAAGEAIPPPSNEVMPTTKTKGAILTVIDPKGYPLLLEWKKRQGQWKITGLSFFCV